jgi:signal transduction histidine kinase
MRLLIFELRPPVLEEEGLAGALESRLYAVERRAGLKADLRVEIEERLPLPVEEGLYRIAQEALNNALKHAHPEHIRIHLRETDRVVRMGVVDNGVGFDVEHLPVGRGMGLSLMKERAEKMGGRLRVESKPGEGTKVIVEVDV